MFRSRNFLSFCGLAIAVTLPCSCLAQDEPTSGLKLQPNVVVQDKMDEGTLAAKVSYFMGFRLMKGFKQQGRDIDKGMLFKGMKAAVQRQGAELSLDKMFEGINSAEAGKELGMSDEQVQAMMSSFGKLVEKKAKEKVEMQAKENSMATKAYMAKTEFSTKYWSKALAPVRRRPIRCELHITERFSMGLCSTQQMDRNGQPSLTSQELSLVSVRRFRR